MKSPLYRYSPCHRCPSGFLALCLAASLGACARGEPKAAQAAGVSEVESQVFALAPGEAHAYQPPASGEPSAEDWARRWLEHLRRGSREGLEFAKERLTLMGQAAAPMLVAEIEANMERGGAMGYLVNLCELMIPCGRPEDGEILLDLIDQGPTPVVRTAAYEALEKLSTQAVVPRLLDQLAFENEAAPAEAAMRALAHAGGPGALAFLEQEVHHWLDGTASGVARDKAFPTLLLSDDPAVVEVLSRLDPLLPPFQQLQAIGVRIHFGQRDFIPRLRPFLDARKFPSPGTRELALQLLGELNDWPSVVAQAEAGELKLQLAVVALLRRPDAVAAGVGLETLDQLATTASDESLRLNALTGLIERGQRERLNPYLRALQEYPFGRGSAEALRLLSRPAFADEQVVGILISRWPQADASHHLDMMRALAVTSSPTAAAFLREVAMDDTVADDLRRTAATVLANFPPTIAVAELLTFYRDSPSPGRASLVIPGLGKHVQVEAADRFLRELALDESAHDEVRRILIEAIPLIYRDRGYALLREIQAATTRSDLRRFVDAILWNYY